MNGLRLFLILLNVCATLCNCDVVDGNSVHHIALTLDSKVLESKAALLAHSLNYGAIQHKGFWDRFDITSPKLLRLIEGISPFMLRVGGTETEYMTFIENCSDSDSSEFDYYHELEHNHRFTAFNLTGCDLDNIMTLASDLQIQPLIDINVNRRDKQNQFDTTNLISMLKYMHKKGYKKVWFQLGNEPNAYKHILHKYWPPKQLVQDYELLKKTLREYGFYTALLFGPEVTKPKVPNMLMVHGDQFLLDFVQSGGAETVDCISWHQYYVDSKATSLDDFTNPVILDYLKSEIKIMLGVLKSNNMTKPVCLTETGSAWGGGARNLSDTFVSGFMLMDKLGVCGLTNVSVVTRQAIYHGHYALISDCLTPNPDYWVSLLYSRLVNRMGHVYRVSCPACTTLQRIYVLESVKRSSVVIMAMNLDKHREVNLKLGGDLTYDSYVLSPQDGDLQSKYVLLNGKALRIEPDGKLPKLVPVASKQITLPPSTYGFFVTSL